MLQMAFRSLVCAIVIYVCVAETPSRGHGHGHHQGQLQAEVSEDGRIMMQKTEEPEPQETEPQRREEPQTQEMELQDHQEPQTHEETELQDHEEPKAEAHEAHEAEALLEEEHDAAESELADGEVEIFSKWGRRRRRRRRRRSRRRAIPCVWHNWGGWTSCSKPCGTGQTSRTRGVKVKAAHGGAGCSGSSKETKNCNTHHCPVNCVWKAFGAWGKCSKSCAGGVQKRSRGVARAAAHGGKKCSGAAEETKKCNEQACPVDCKYAEWGEWADCSVTCGNGTRKHAREVETEAQHGGAECEGEKEEEGACDPPPEKCAALRQGTSLLLLALWLATEVSARG
mmetsp:Transcript_62971/g.99934  ORF Transcript_62971/g.99934 Transcript_62971/m.99934 type:complete len:340 (+) Transcript_62971:104-1123(+)